MLLGEDKFDVIVDVLLLLALKIGVPPAFKSKPLLPPFASKFIAQ